MGLGVRFAHTTASVLPSAKRGQQRGAKQHGRLGG